MKEEMSQEETMKIVSELLTAFCSTYSTFLVGKKVTKNKMIDIMSRNSNAEELIKDKPRELFTRIAPIFIKLANSDELGELDIDVALKEFRKDFDERLDAILEKERGAVKEDSKGRKKQ